jgi:hypothetical protein
MDGKNMIIAILIAVIVIAVYKVFTNTQIYNTSLKQPVTTNQTALQQPRDHNTSLTIFNHYAIPVNVIISCIDKTVINIPNVPPNETKISYINKNLNTEYALVNIFNSRDGSKLASVILTNDMPTDVKHISTLHCGLIYGYNDISLQSELTRSPLGSALPRLIISNKGAQNITLNSASGNSMTIPRSRDKSLVYLGEYKTGIPLGTKFRDINNIFPTYELIKPITNLVYGVISTTYIPSYQGSFYPGENTNVDGKFFHPLSELSWYQFHKGKLIDNSYIPNDW